VAEQQESKEKLLTGFTTGTASAAASKAAILAIINQKKIESVEVTLPKGDSIPIKIYNCEFGESKAKCSVIKDAGDDPDVTHGAEIVVELSLTSNVNQIEIDGGKGVGVVTKPGLGLEINKAAINPIPKKMIKGNVTEVAKETLQKNGINIIISVPKGKELALKTDNPRLGIVGGISILGTSGIVIPYSTASFAAAVRQNLDVSLAMGNDTVVLATGGRSEEFAKKIVDLPEHSFVQMGDFAGYTIQQCAKKKIKKAYVVGFIGKLAKMAAGVKQTHVKGSKVDMNLLAEIAEKCNADLEIISQIRKANTARHVQDIVMEHNVEGFFDKICDLVYKHMRNHSEEKVSIDVILFDFDGKVLGRYPTKEGILLN
jgi:cobalt-precorrin-5B (C1)-methyltransferase